MNKVARYLWDRSRGGIAIVGLLAALQAIQAWLSVRFALGTRVLIDSAENGKDALFQESVWTLAGIVTAMVLSYLLVTLLRDHVTAKLDRQWKSHLSNTLFTSQYRAVSAFHTGELINRLTNDVRTVTSAIVSLVPNVVSLLLRGILAAWTLAQMEARLTGLLLAGGALTVAAVAVMRQRLKYLSKAVSASEGRLSGFLQETLGKLLVIQALDVSPETGRRREGFLEDRWQKQRQRRLYGAMGGSAMVAACYAMRLLALIYCSGKLLHSSMSFGTFMAVTQMVSMLEGPIMNFSGVFPQYFGMIASAERLQELDALPREPGHIRDCTALYRDMEQLEAQGLCFDYEDRQDVLKDVSFTIPKGSFAVITGDSGSGKSTLLKVLLGLLPAGAGSCSIIGAGGAIPIGRDTRGLFAYVPPGSMLLSGTIRENLLLVRPQATEQELEQAAHIACLDEVIGQLPDGLDTMLGENATGLSEGQAQRINIARAVLSEAPVLLLDEATSALDMETERTVLERLRAQRDRTCIAVTHRLRALDYADIRITIALDGTAVCEKLAQ